MARQPPREQAHEPAAEPLSGAARACIRCADCAPACPERLDPQALHFALLRADGAEAEALGLLACTGCSACDRVCPSDLPLSAHFREAGEARIEARARTASADAARERHRQRAERLAQAANEADTLQARRAQRLSGAAAAALAKARARRGPGPV